MKNKNQFDSRRHFLLKAATAALAAPVLLGQPLKAASPSGRLQHACIGVGGMGWGDLNQFKKHANVDIVAICDVDEKNLKRASELLPHARTYTDWREMFKQESDKIDSVNVSVPDHNHFVIAIEAIRKRNHRSWYCGGY